MERFLVVGTTTLNHWSCPFPKEPQLGNGNSPEAVAPILESKRGLQVLSGPKVKGVALAQSLFAGCA
jgi:hypothetical protein